MFEITTNRIFKTEAKAINYCVKYNIPFKDIKKVNNKFEVLAHPKDIESLTIPGCYIDRYGNHHYSK